MDWLQRRDAPRVIGRAAIALAFAIAPVIIVLASPRIAAGEPKRVPWRFQWSGDQVGEECKDGGAVQAAIAHRLGYDPFWPSAERTIVAELVRREQGFAATIRFSESGFTVSKHLESSAPDCDIIRSAVAFAVAIAIEERAVKGVLDDVDAATAEPADAASTDAAAAEASVDGGSARRRDSRATADASAPPAVGTEGTIAVAGTVGAGLLPRAAIGVDVHGLVRIRGALALSLGLSHFPEVRLDDRFEFGITLGRLGVCADGVRHKATSLAACAHAELGSGYSIVRTLQPLRPGSRLFGAVGVGGLFVQRFAPFAVLVGADLVVPLPRLAFDVDGTGERAFTFSPVAGHFFVGLGFGGY